MDRSEKKGDDSLRFWITLLTGFATGRPLNRVHYLDRTIRWAASLP
mgnify:CR=1 FL=1